MSLGTPFFFSDTVWPPPASRTVIVAHQFKILSLCYRLLAQPKLSNACGISPIKTSPNTEGSEWPEYNLIVHSEGKGPRTNCTMAHLQLSFQLAQINFYFSLLPRPCSYYCQYPLELLFLVFWNFSIVHSPSKVGLIIAKSSQNYNVEVIRFQLLSQFPIDKFTHNYKSSGRFLF